MRKKTRAIKKPWRKAARPEIFAVVMARGGSVGLPGKSLRNLLGRPVLAYTLDHVRASKWVSRSVVSSDAPAILALARKGQFEVIQRPAELATATSATDPVLRHAVRSVYGEPNLRGTNPNALKLNALKPGALQPGALKKSAILPFAVVMLYGNVPVRRGNMIDRCIEMLWQTGCDSVQTIAPVGKMHPYWMFDLDGHSRITKHIANHVFRRQDLPELYSPTGAVYVIRTEVLMAAEASTDPHAFLGKDRRGLVVMPEDSVDIDTEKDLWVAQAVLRAGTST